MWSPRSLLTMRWTPAERKRINRAFAMGRMPEDLPTVTHDGSTYLDLRGFPLESSILVSLRRVDLSDCNMVRSGVHRKVRLADCLFRGARLWATIGYDVRRCDFSHAQGKGAELRGSFRDCTFADANLTAVKSTPGSKFVRCDFSGARLRGAEMNDVEFDQCRWEGAMFGGMACLVDSRFVGTHPSPEQLGDALLDDPHEKRLQAEVERELARRGNARLRRR